VGTKPYIEVIVGVVLLSHAPVVSLIVYFLIRRIRVLLKVRNDFEMKEVLGVFFPCCLYDPQAIRRVPSTK
jgi:hypothetical protein